MSGVAQGVRTRNEGDGGLRLNRPVPPLSSRLQRVTSCLSSVTCLDRRYWASSPVNPSGPGWGQGPEHPSYPLGRPGPPHPGEEAFWPLGPGCMPPVTSWTGSPGRSGPAVPSRGLYPRSSGLGEPLILPDILSAPHPLRAPGPGCGDRLRSSQEKG